LAAVIFASESSTIEKLLKGEYGDLFTEFLDFLFHALEAVERKR